MKNHRYEIKISTPINPDFPDEFVYKRVKVEYIKDGEIYDTRNFFNANGHYMFGSCAEWLAQNIFTQQNLIPEEAK